MQLLQRLMACALLIAAAGAACGDDGDEPASDVKGGDVAGADSDSTGGLPDSTPGPDGTSEVDTGGDSDVQPVACCTAESDCAPGMWCLGGPPGFCLEKFPSDGCWDDKDCTGGDEWCEDAVILACGPGAAAPQMGLCLHDDPGLQCCADDLDCSSGNRCIQGNCAPKPTNGACHTADDCGPAMSCEGASIVACEDEQQSVTAGVCKSGGEGCCTTKVDCKDGEQCIPSPAVCKPAGTGAACWSDADCPGGLHCGGAIICPCLADCVQADVPGKCQGGPVGCCTSDFDCEKGQRCVGGGIDVGVCKPFPDFGSCWDGNDCAPTQTCSGGAICPCNADCDQEDTLGACMGEYGGCCTGAGVCPAGQTCIPLSGIGWSTCVQSPPPGQCWSAADCPAGHTCHGAAFCPCQQDCDMAYEGPGVCSPQDGSCTAIDPSWVKEWCDAASLVIFDGEKCVQTCPGCCECTPFCDKTFQSLAECNAACVPGAACTLWSGTCDDAIPEKPWWARTAAGCIEITTCVCEGCPGTYDTEAACKAACP